MPTRGISDEAALERYNAYKRHGDNSLLAGKELGLGHKAILLGKKETERRGLHLSQGVRGAIANAGLNASEAKGGWIHNYDADNKKIGTTRWSAPEIGVEAFIDRIASAFDGLPATPPIIRSLEETRSDMLAFCPHSDFHLGMVTCAEQSGRDYNRKIACERIKDGMAQSLAGQPACELAIIMNAGDLLHSNDDTDQTPRNKHNLKTEGTHHQNIEIAIETTVCLIDMALSKHGTVEYRGLPGNHDPNIPAPLSMALRAYYRNEPRVNVVVKENPFWQRNFGVNFLSAHHGDGRKPKEVAASLSGMFPKEWGKAKYWHFFTGHKHNSSSDTFGHVQWRQLPAVCSLDPYAAALAYGGVAGVRSMTFHASEGLRSDMTINL